MNGAKEVYVERRGMLEETKVMFKDDAHLMRVINKIVSAIGRRVDASSPMVDARLADGSRVNVIVPPLAIDGPHLSIRRFGHIPVTEADLLANETLTIPMLGLLKAAVAARLNIIISGGTGAGKTTLLNVLSGYISTKGTHRHHRRLSRAATEATSRSPIRSVALRIPTAKERFRPVSWSSTACVCGPTESSSAKFAAKKRSTCSRP